jgi:hypothetical protein
MRPVAIATPPVARVKVAMRTSIRLFYTDLLIFKMNFAACHQQCLIHAVKVVGQYYSETPSLKYWLFIFSDTPLWLHVLPSWWYTPGSMNVLVLNVPPCYSDVAMLSYQYVPLIYICIWNHFSPLCLFGNIELSL